MRAFAEKLLPTILGLLTAAALTVFLVRSRVRQGQLGSQLAEARDRTEKLARELEDLKEQTRTLEAELELARAAQFSAREELNRFRRSRAKMSRVTASERTLAAELAESGIEHTRMLFRGRAQLDRTRDALIEDRGALLEARERSENLRRAVVRISRERDELEKLLQDSREAARLRRELEELAKRIERLVAEAE